MNKPELFPEEKLLSYSKYYYIEPDPFNPLATQIIRKPLDEEDVFWPDRVEEMFKPGYQDAMFGYYIFEGGSYTSFYAQLHGVKTEMIDWFFVWMCIPPKSVPREHGNLRYKLWVPVDHYDHYPDDEWSEKRLTDETIPYKLRRQGINDAAIESIDLGKSGKYKTLHMHLMPPTKLSLPQECWDYINAIGTMNVFASDHSVNLQFFRNTNYGCECIMRNWRGYVLNDEGKIVRMTKEYPTPTKEHVVQDIYHNLVEIPHMAKFLPQLYAEESNKPVDAY